MADERDGATSDAGAGPPDTFAAPAGQGDWVVLTRVTDIAAASVLRALLSDAGIDCQVPDEHTAGVAWHLSGAIGGVAVLVREADFDAATPLVSDDIALDPDAIPEELREDAPSANAAEAEDAARRDAQEAAARRATKVAVVATLFCVLLPYAANVCLSAMNAPDLPDKVRRNLTLAFAVTVGQLMMWGVICLLTLQSALSTG